MTALLNRPVISPELIGRTEHVTALRHMLQQSKAGSGQVVLIAGEAGVGKTRLTTDVARHAVGLGFRVLRGTCFQADATSPYAPLLDLLRMDVAGQPPAAIRAVLGPSAPIIGPLVPDLVSLLEDGAAPPVSAVVREKHQLIAAFIQVFLRQVANGPLLLIFEDLHWGDDNSLECLHALARICHQHPLVILLTYRDDELHPSLRHWLAQLDRERLAHEIRLSPLLRGEIDAMLRAIFQLSRPVRTEFLDAISALTEGNPFFIEEVLTSLIAAGAIYYRDGDWDRKAMGEFNIPRSIQDAVQQRADRLTEPAHRLLRMAAVVGRRFDFSLLQALTNQDEQPLLERLKELIVAGLVVEETEDQFAFRHALTREAIYAGLLVRERRALHQATADALERNHAAPEAHLTDLAHHCYQSGRWEQALGYSRQAGERALALYAPRAAIEQLSHALEAGRQLGVSTLPAVLRHRAQAYEWVGDFEAARQDYEAALVGAGAAQEREVEWQTLHDLGMLWTGREFERSRNYYEQALDLARTLDQPVMVGHSLNRLGNWCANADRPGEAKRFHDEALLLFQTLGDQRGVASTLDLLGIAAIMSGDLSQSVACYQQAVRLWEDLDLRRELVSSLGALAVGGGILHGNSVVPAIPSTVAVREAERAWAIATEIGWRAGESFAQTVLGAHLGMRGEYERAIDLVQTALVIGIEIDHRAWIAQARHVLGGLYLDLLLLPPAIKHLEDALSVASELGSLYRIRSVTGMLASAYVADNQLARAESVLDAVVGPETPAETLGQRPCWYARAELLLVRGEPDHALAIADRLIAATRNVGQAGLTALPHLALLRGDALAALERPTDAESSFRAAITGAIHQGARPLLWRVHLALGCLYHGQQRSADAERELDDAWGVIEERAATIAEPALREAFLQQAVVRFPEPYSRSMHRPVGQATAGLSAREREVAALIAEGRTNGEIAEALFVSKRTVETHAGSILSKLGFTTRAQIIAWVLANGAAISGDQPTG